MRHADPHVDADASDVAGLQSLALTLDADADDDAVQDYFEAQGWTDGLPIVAPTPARVQSMIDGSGLAGTTPVAQIAPANVMATVEKVAINAVMAGCRPVYMPVILAALRALAKPDFNLAGFQATTHPGAPLLWINGPIRQRIGLNCGTNVFGQGTRANASIGRALRLVMTNIGEGIPGKSDFSTHGSPCKFSYCAGENEEKSPWPPLHVDHGWNAQQSTVMVFAADGPHNVNDHGSQSADDLLTTIADVMNTVGSNNIYLGGEVVLVCSPEHAQLLALEGMSKDDVRNALFERLRVDLSRVSAGNRKRFATIRAAFDATPGTVSIPYFDDPAQIIILVAGGPGRHSLVIPGFGISMAAMEPIDPPQG